MLIRDVDSKVGYPLKLGLRNAKLIARLGEVVGRSSSELYHSTIRNCMWPTPNVLYTMVARKR